MAADAAGRRHPGCGTVGEGVARLLTTSREKLDGRLGQGPRLRRILELRPLEDADFEALRTDAIEAILEDEAIDVVVECIGGCGVALDFTRRALEAGKHVVTSNKDLVAAHGVELLALAVERGRRYLFEAAVGGGIPIIQVLSEQLAANEVQQIAGIVNGTTNYILDQMGRLGRGFAESLDEAQALGYAERDPSADVDGIDSARKLAILAAMVSDELPDWSQLTVVGIRVVELADIELAESLDAYVRLIASYQRRDDGRIALAVAPRLVPTQHPLAVAHGVYNAILVDGSATGQTLFYGRGAGALPTASAVVADLLQLALSPWSETSALRWRAADPEQQLDVAQLPLDGVLRARDAATAAAITQAGLALEPIAGREDAWRVRAADGWTWASLPEALEARGIARDTTSLLPWLEWRED